MSAVENMLLLSASDPSPVELVNWESELPLLLVCEHAGRAVPMSLGDLGVGADVLNSHRGWDINAEKVARSVAEILGAPLIIQRYSRLVIDSNRPPESAGAIPDASDQMEIPGNRDISEKDRDMRIAEIFSPFDQAIRDGFSRENRWAAFSIHSFTPDLSGTTRPWHAGFLSRKSQTTATQLMNSVAAAKPGLSLAINEPYQIDDDSDWFIPVHAEPRNLPHCLIEIRNDQIVTADEIQSWASVLAIGMLEILRELK